MFITIINVATYKQFKMEMHPLIVKLQEHKTVQHIRLHQDFFSSMVVMVTFPLLYQNGKHKLLKVARDYF